MTIVSILVIGLIIVTLIIISEFVAVLRELDNIAYLLAHIAEHMPDRSSDE